MVESKHYLAVLSDAVVAGGVEAWLAVRSKLFELGALGMNQHSLSPVFDCGGALTPEQSDWHCVAKEHIELPGGSSSIWLLRLNDAILEIIERIGDREEEVLREWSAHHLNAPFGPMSEEERAKLSIGCRERAYQRYSKLLPVLRAMVADCRLSGNGIYVILERIERH